jgi:hypothetical protein
MALALTLPPVLALAAEPAWDRQANIESAAVRLAELQQARGALGTYEHISACYKTHTLGSAPTAGLEGCLVLDYIHSNVTAALFTRLGPDKRREMQVPEPDLLLTDMSRRIGGALAQYKIDEAGVRAWVTLIERHGMPAYTKARFPGRGERKEQPQ